MYNLAAIELFDVSSSVYVLSAMTVLLAVMIALYCANFLKDDRIASIRTTTDAQILENVTSAQQEELFETLDYDDGAEIQHTLRQRLSEQSESDNDNDDDDFSNAQRHGDGLVSKLKSARLKELEAQLTKEQLEEERRIEREQLSAIFELLKKQETELNMKEIDESELSSQLHLYR